MGIVDLLLMLLFGGIFGYIAAQLMGQRRINVVWLIVFGFVGALLGRFVANYFHLPTIFALNIGGSSFDVVWSLAGCLLVLAVVGLLGQH